MTRPATAASSGRQALAANVRARRQCGADNDVSGADSEQEARPRPDHEIRGKKSRTSKNAKYRRSLRGRLLLPRQADKTRRDIDDAVALTSTCDVNKAAGGI